jgi:Xaa-Pro aminopeptidase
MDFPGRRARLAARLSELEIDAFLVTRLPNVRYLTGFTGSNAQLVLGREGGVFLTDGRYTEQSRHEVPELERVTYPAFPPAFADAASSLEAHRVGFEATGVTYRQYRDLADTDGFDLVPTDGEVERLRWVKEPEEIEMVAQAQAITDDCFDAIVGKLAEGMTEREVALEMELTMRQNGADALAFESIVAFGESAAEPHHHPTDRALRPGDCVKLDFGALYRGYHSDMTRTVMFGEPSGELREIYDLVRAAQQAGIDAVRPGIHGGEADAASRKVIEEAGRGDAFSHSLGHGVGLEIHEGPTLRAKGEDELPVGAVVTVEPGVYVPGLGGVRIEDMVEVTDDGCRPMPRSTRDLVVL